MRWGQGSRAKDPLFKDTREKGGGLAWLCKVREVDSECPEGHCCLSGF